MKAIVGWFKRNLMSLSPNLKSITLCTECTSEGQRRGARGERAARTAMFMAVLAFSRDAIRFTIHCQLVENHC
jgi:hypothetical protein